MAMGQGLEFAKAVQELGEKSKCGLLTDYGLALRSAIEHFKISDMESLVANFPEVLGKLEKLVETS